MKQFNNDMLIGGRFISAPQTLSSIDPSTGKPWFEVPDAGRDAINAAVAAARTAFETSAWRRCGQLRGEVLRAIASAVRENADDLAAVESRDNGKPLWATNFELSNISRYFDYFAGLADKIEGSYIPLDDDLSVTVRHEPYGVVGAITTWNSPLLLLAMKLAPSLAAGNTVVLKPADNASASTLAVAGLLPETGIPGGVVNIVTGGTDVGRWLVEHDDVDLISFTGGDVTAERVLASAARGLKPVTVEAGGKAAHIIFEDADMDAAVVAAVAGGFISSGQSCTAGARVLVQASIYDEFVDKFVARAKRLRVGRWDDPTTHVGPLATATHWEQVRDYVEGGIKQGATRLLGDRVDGLPSGGFFYPVTILADVSVDMTVAQKEIFGPVVTIIKFIDEADAVEKANSTQYGLSSGMWTRDGQKAERVAQAIEAGIVWINCYRILHWAVPFGGYKRSGMRRENGVDALREYTQVKSVMSSSVSKALDPFGLDD